MVELPNPGDNSMKKISIAFAAALALMAFGGCKKKGGSEMIAMADDVCKCSEGKAEEMKKCMEDVTKKYTKEGEAAKSSGEVKPPTDEEMAALKKQAACVQKMQDSMKGGTGDMKPDDKKPDDKKPDDKKPDDKKPDDKAAGGGGASTGVKECDDVVAAYEKLFSCDKFKGMPAEAQDAQKKGLETMKTSWHFDNDQMKEAAKPGCKAALDGLQQSAKAMGCEI
jgi:hypothetical protein